MKKKVVFLFATALFFNSIISCYASTITFTNSYKKTLWSPHGVECTLNARNWRKKLKDGSVKVHFVSTKKNYSVDILMLDENNNYIWSQDDTIVAKKSLQTSRTYKLGNDHSKYRLFFRPSTTKLAAGGYVSVSNPKNCSLSDYYNYNLN